MKCCLYLFACILLAMRGVSQNVGVGTATPAERLDVNGNINVTGTIKANGVDGNPNQVLMKNANGVLSWGDLCDYKNFQLFEEVGVQQWVVPAGVTKIGAELWGAGGGGSMYCGGGGGAYVRGYFIVVPGDIIYINIGAGGTGGVAPGPGGVTEVVSGLNGLAAFSGSPGGTNVNAISIGDGGHGIATANYRNYFYIPGEPGQLATTKFITTATNSYEITEGGAGGNAGNTTNTGGTAAYRVIQTASGMTVRNGVGETGKVPGGGGGAGLTLLQTLATVNGQSGASGRVVIHY